MRVFGNVYICISPSELRPLLLLLQKQWSFVLYVFNDMYMGSLKSFLFQYEGIELEI